MRTIEPKSCGCACNPPAPAWETELYEYIKALGNQVPIIDIGQVFINWAMTLDNFDWYDWDSLLDRTFPGQDWSQIDFSEEKMPPIDWSETL